MNRHRLGLILFWVGAAYIFAASWLAMWWVAPIFANTPPEELEGTIWAFGGLVFNLVALSVPLGIVSMATGTLLLGESRKRRVWPYLLGIVLLMLSFIYPPTLGYHPVAFGVSGGIILVLFFAVLWLSAKKRRTLTGVARTAADFLTLSYVFFVLTAFLMCTLLGNPYSGLYFPEKVIAENALP